MRAELSAYEGRPIPWAARQSPSGHDVLTYTDASPAPEPSHDSPADGETPVELCPQGPPRHMSTRNAILPSHAGWGVSVSGSA
nr:DUF6417 family protein [Streptomyces durhamensis]